MGFVLITFSINGQDLKMGAERTGEYLNLLYKKRIAIVGNQTSMIANTHLVDSLLSLKVNILKVFSPEHGFRGEADAGEKIKDELDKKTGIPIISIYGDNKKPKQNQLEEIDIILFDIQDVGARFYTYISTLHYVMEAAAENSICLLYTSPSPRDGLLSRMPSSA